MSKALDGYLCELERELVHQRGRVLRLELTVGTLIQWMVQSANAPINGQDAQQLMNMLLVPDQDRTS